MYPISRQDLVKVMFFLIIPGYLGGGNHKFEDIIAGKFRKTHSKVLRDIANLSCSQEFRAANFGESSYISKQKKEFPMYYVTKDGFSFLVFG